MSQTAGSQYVHRTVLGDTGIYAIVRHPQPLAWPMFSVALMLVVQRWAVVALGVASPALVLWGLRDADADGSERFGDAYRDSMRRVPAWNPFAGGWRRVCRRKGDPRRSAAGAADGVGSGTRPQGAVRRRPA